MPELSLRLKATLCPDGIELVRRVRYPDIASRYGRSGPEWFSCKSDRYRREIIRDAIDLEDALVCRFVNADTDEKRIAFLSRFGLPTQLFPSEPRNFILGEQRLLRRLLERACSGNVEQAMKAGNESLRHGHAGGLTLSLDLEGRLVHTWESPMSFMHMEIAVAARIGARLGSCKRCGSLFLYGTGTKRRKTAKWCGAACRVGAHRATKSKRKRKGG